MKLTELDGKFYRYDRRIEPRDFILGDPATWRERGCPSESRIGPVDYLVPVETVSEAQVVQFLCPICFKANNGPVGTHSVEVPFADRGILDDQSMHNQEGKPVRWQVSGTGLNDLTTTPSILLLVGCGWHGYITNGEVTVV